MSPLNPIDENRVRDILEEERNDSQFGVGALQYHVHNGVDSPQVPFTNILQAPIYFCAASTTSGTTAVYVFGTNGLPYTIKITGIFLDPLDVTASNIVVKNNGNQVVSIPKLTTIGAMQGSAVAMGILGTLPTVVAGNPLTIVSDLGGNATVFFTFTV